MGEKKPRSLVEFVRDMKRSNCAICAIPDPDIKAQLKAATEKKIKRGWVLQWLRDECGIEVTDADMNRHYSGRHDNDV